MAPIFAILAVSLLSTYKTLRFYFWHDDFSVLYQVVAKDCVLPWPYTSYCSLFSFFYKIFGLNPRGYFGLGVILFVFVCIIFYLFLKRLYDSKRALFATCLLATSYLGLGVFYESYDSITLFASVGTYILSLVFLYDGLANPKRRISCFFSLVVFSISVLILQARSATYIFPYLVLIFLFSRSLKLSKRIALATLSVVLYFIFFNVVGSSGNSIVGGVSLFKFVIGTNIYAEFIDFLQNLSLIIFTDFALMFFVPSQIVKTITGLIILVIFSLFLFSSWKKKDFPVKQVFLGVLMFVSFYLPYALRSDQVLNSNHRYLWPAFLGMLVIVPVFLKEGVARIIVIILILVGLVQSNYYFGKFLSDSHSRQRFYQQLKHILPEIKKDDVIYVSATEVESQKAADFLRVGNFSSEASVAIFYGIRYKDFRLITNGDELSRVLQRKDFGLESLYVFHYDQDKLTDYTDRVRENIVESKYFYSVLNKKVSTEFTKSEELTSGKFEEPEFKIEGFLGVIPSRLDITMTTRIPDIPLPFSKDCLSCKKDYNPSMAYSYLTISKLLKKGMRVYVSNSWENTDAQSLIDNDDTTYWVADRPKWFSGERPIIKLEFDQRSNISGVSLKSDLKNRRPIDFEVFVDGRKIDYVKSEYQDWSIITFEDLSVGEIEIKMLSTSGGDTPAIEEMAISPGGYQDVNFSDILQTRSFPAAFLREKSHKDAFVSYAKSGIGACIKWSIPGEVERMKEFEIMADGRPRKYSIVIPSLGVEEPTFKLGCINYPLEVNLFWAGAGFLGDNKN